MYDDQNTSAYARPQTVHDLASSLVRRLGHDRAVGLCRANGWDRIRRIIESPMVPGFTDTFAGR